MSKKKEVEALFREEQERWHASAKKEFQPNATVVIKPKFSQKKELLIAEIGVYLWMGIPQIEIAKRVGKSYRALTSFMFRNGLSKPRQGVSRRNQRIVTLFLKGSSPKEIARKEDLQKRTVLKILRTQLPLSIRQRTRHYVRDQRLPVEKVIALTTEGQSSASIATLLGLSTRQIQEIRYRYRNDGIPRKQKRKKRRSGSREKNN